MDTTSFDTFLASLNNTIIDVTNGNEANSVLLPYSQSYYLTVCIVRSDSERVSIFNLHDLNHERFNKIEFSKNLPHEFRGSFTEDQLQHTIEYIENLCKIKKQIVYTDEGFILICETVLIFFAREFLINSPSQLQ